MYDPYDDPWSTSTYPSVHPQNDLVTHLVFVGGRLAESWSEEAAESKYADFARSLAAERHRLRTAPPAPEVPSHVRLLAWFPTSGYSICTQSALRDHFGLTAYPSAYGKAVQSALRTSLPTDLHWGWRSSPLGPTPDLAPLGRPSLLTATTRRTLIRLRDQALASERIAANGDFPQAG